MLELPALITLGTVVLIITLLAVTRIAPDLIFAGGLTVLLLTGVLSPEQALAGFANQGVVTVGVLYVVVAGLRETGGVHWLSKRLLGRPRSLPGAQLRLMGPVALLSTILNNTPVVAMLIPAVSDWAKKFSFSTSKLMIPLSFAAILGGTCTLIGTSTNLVVNGLLLAEDSSLGLELFSLVGVGVPMSLAGIAFIFLTSRWLLPDRRPALSVHDDAREYSVEMLVAANGPLVGQTIEEAGLRHLPSMYLAEIERDGRILAAISPKETLYAGDVLVFVGIVESVVEVQRIRGLSPATDQVLKLNVPRPQRSLIEAVVSESSPVIGKSIRAGRFRAVYDAVVIAVARNGKRIHKKVGDIVLQPGDTLLLETRPAFVTQQRNSRDFYLVSLLEDSHPLRFERATAAIAILAGMVASAALGLFSMLQAALLAAGLMIVSGCCSGVTARRSIDWSVLIVIASAFGIRPALETSGVAGAVAGTLMVLAGDNLYLNLAVLYLVTTLFTAIITNNAAAALMFPLALALSDSLGVSVLPFAVAIMMSASTSFATPIGYQTNMMVYGPGGYRFADYLKIGLPLTLLTGAIAVLIIPQIWSF